MAENKHNDNLPVQYVHEDSVGQFMLLPDMPDYVMKARGPVIDSVMSQGLMEEGAYLVDDTSEVPAGKPLPIQTRVLLSYEGLDLDAGGKIHLNAFDREVIDAVASLAQTNEVITPAMIYRVMMGKKEYQYVTPHQEQRVVDSMRKCAFSRIQLDLTDMMEKDSPVGKQLKKAGVSARYSGNLLSFETVELKKGNKMVRCFRILSQPAIIRYAASTGKISEFPIDMLDTRVNKTERNIILQSFLLRTIEEMRRGERVSRFIDVSQLYEAVAATNDTKQQKARYRSAAIIILEDWVSKNFIKGFTVRKAGGIIKGFDIALFPNKKQAIDA